jgi:hypothetical protein
VDAPTNLNDQDAYTAGVRRTFTFTNRSEYALHVEYTSLRTRGAGADGLDTRSNTFFVGVDFAY